MALRGNQSFIREGHPEDLKVEASFLTLVLYLPIPAMEGIRRTTVKGVVVPPDCFASLFNKLRSI